MSEPTPRDFRPLIAAYIAAQAKPIDKLGHQPRLYQLAKQVGAGAQYDDDVLFAAAWLHDLGVFIGHRPENLEELARWNNVTYALAKAPEILERVEFPPRKIPAVLDAIRDHQPSAQPATIEGIILRDADILEQLGAIGILRTVAKIGRDTRFQTFTAAVDALRHSLATLPQQIRLPTTRALAEPKILAMSAFLEAVKVEDQGALF